MSNYYRSSGSSSKLTEINESIVSLLIKLHNKLTDQQGSYVPLTLRSDTIDKSDLVGSGPHFVGRLLDAICASSSRSAQDVEGIYRDLLPKMSSDPTSISAKYVKFDSVS